MVGRTVDATLCPPRWL